MDRYLPSRHQSTRFCLECEYKIRARGSTWPCASPATPLWFRSPSVGSRKCPLCFCSTSNEFAFCPAMTVYVRNPRRECPAVVEHHTAVCCVLVRFFEC